VTHNIENILANRNNNNKNKKKSMVRVANAQKIGGMGSYSVADLKKSLNAVVRQGLRSAGTAGGAYLGSQVGMANTGARMGKTVGARISKLIGSGDYATSVDVTMNSLCKPGMNQYASFADSKSSVRLCHREYLQDAFTGSLVSVFNNTGFAINPGLSNTFPFLSQIANNFEEYKFHGLVFEFVSTTSPYNAGSQMGSVIMAMEYNAESALYTSKPQMENSDFAISARPDKSMLYGVVCADNAVHHLYVRSGPSTIPLTSTDIGLFQFATLSPLNANTTLGEIWVTYDVELFRPKISPFKPGYYHLGATVSNGLAAGPLVTGDYVITRPSGVSPVAPASNGSYSGVTIPVASSGNTLTLNDADVGDVFLLSVDISAVSALTQTLTVSSTGLTSLNAFGGYTSSSVQCNSLGGATFDGIFQVNTNAVAPTITFATGQALTSNGFFDVMITAIGNGQTINNV